MRQTQAGNDLSGLVVKWNAITGDGKRGKRFTSNVKSTSVSGKMVVGRIIKSSSSRRARRPSNFIFRPSACAEMTHIYIYMYVRILMIERQHCSPSGTPRDPTKVFPKDRVAHGRDNRPRVLQPKKKKKRKEIPFKRSLFPLRKILCLSDKRHPLCLAFFSLSHTHTHTHTLSLSPFFRCFVFVPSRCSLISWRRNWHEVNTTEAQGRRLIKCQSARHIISATPVPFILHLRESADNPTNE